MPNPYRDGYEPFPKAVRMAALAVAGGQCQACGRDDLPLEVDHWTPQSAGGSSEQDNAIVLCKSCHQLKSKAESAAGSRQYHAKRVERRAEHTRYVEQHPNNPRSQ